MKSLVSRLTGGFHDASIRIQYVQRRHLDLLGLTFQTQPRLCHPSRRQGYRLRPIPTRHCRPSSPHTTKDERHPALHGGTSKSGVCFFFFSFSLTKPKPTPTPRPHEPSLPAFGTSETTTIFEHTWDPLEIGHLAQTDCDGRVPAGNYEWPFELLIPGTTPETTKGCARCSIAYYLKADTIRDEPGQPPQAFRCIRVMRTLPTAEFEMMDAATVEGKPEQMCFAVSITHRAVALGTSIPVEVDVTPQAGWRVKSITGRLIEVHRLERELGDGFDGSREVLGWDMLEMREEVPEKEADNHVCIMEELPLPREAKYCSPDVDVLGIQISHVLHVDIRVEDEKGVVTKASQTSPAGILELTSIAKRAHSCHFIRLSGHAHQRHGQLCADAVAEPCEHMCWGLGAAAVRLPSR